MTKCRWGRETMNKDAIRLLLVEDTPGDAMLLNIALAKSKTIPFQITHAKNFQEALGYLQQQIDVILLDLSLKKVISNIAAKIPFLATIPKAFALPPSKVALDDSAVKPIGASAPTNE